MEKVLIEATVMLDSHATNYFVYFYFVGTEQMQSATARVMYFLQSGVLHCHVPTGAARTPRPTLSLSHPSSLAPFIFICRSIICCHVIIVMLATIADSRSITVMEEF